MKKFLLLITFFAATLSVPAARHATSPPRHAPASARIQPAAPSASTPPVEPVAPAPATALTPAPDQPAPPDSQIALVPATSPSIPAQPSDDNTVLQSSDTYDSLLTTWYNRNIDLSPEQIYDYFVNIDSTATTVSDVPDSVYQARLKAILSPIPMPFNDVIKRYLVVYTQTRKSTMARILGLSQYYFPMIEQELSNADMPLELRMLPVIESALNPVATSRMGAAGLWQFMYFTGKTYGLEVTSFVDQRRDPLASTRAAIKYLKDLYLLFGDWTLAISAYNCGPGNVNKALHRAGPDAKTFWDIYPYLPRETRGYYPAFVAATYAYKYHQMHGIDPIAPPIPMSTDTVLIGNLMHFEQISSTIGTPIETLRMLNPQYKSDVIPAVDKQYVLTLPHQDVPNFIDHQKEILAKDTLYLREYLRTDAAATKKQFDISSTIHKVRSGESLSLIAKKYGVTTSQIMKWNKLKSSKLRAGQLLTIYR